MKDLAGYTILLRKVSIVMNLTIEELKERLVQIYDPDDIIEALEITTEELLNAFEEKLTANLHKFREEVESDTAN